LQSDQPTDIFLERLKSARDFRQFSQTDLAVKAGLPPSSVSHFESGARKPSFDNLKKLATALNVTTDYLLGRSDTPTASSTAGQIHRDMHKLNADDLKLTEAFVEMLIQRGQSKDSK
jgi:transcriptional regulator with XRE-family HTH domain